MQRHDSRELLAEGMKVYGADGGKVGSVVALTPRQLVVERGFFFPTDYAIPLTAVDRVEIDAVWLNVPKDVALHQQWDVDQAAADADRVLTAPIPANDAAPTPTRLTDAAGTSAPADDVEPIRRYSTDNTQDEPRLDPPPAAGWPTDTTAGAS